MKTIELVILIVAVTVLALVLSASVIAPDNSSFLNINFSLEGLQKPGTGSIGSGASPAEIISSVFNDLTGGTGSQSLDCG